MSEQRTANKTVWQHPIATAATYTYRVVGRHQLTPQMINLYLKPGQARLPFQAGQAVEILSRMGQRRLCAIASAPQKPYLELHVADQQGAADTWLQQHLREKSLLRLRGPLGGFSTPINPLRPVLMIAEGQGFTPLKSILEALFHQGNERPVYLYWGGEQLEELYLHELPAAWTDKHLRFHYTPVLQAPEGSWAGRRGELIAAVLEDFPNLTAYEVYVSGEPAFVQHARLALCDQGLAPEQLHEPVSRDLLDPGHRPTGQVAV